MRAGKRRFTSIFLALVMVLTLLPSTALAAEPEESTKPAVTEDVTKEEQTSEEKDSKETKETIGTTETKEATDTTEKTKTKESSDAQEEKQAEETKQEEKASSYTVEVLLPETEEGEPTLKTAEKSGDLKQIVKDGGVFQDIVLVYEVSEEELASYTEEEKEALSAQVKAWAEALNTALQDTGLQAAYKAASKGEDGSETPESIVISGTPTKDVKVDVEEILANAENPQELADETSKEAVYVQAAVTGEDGTTSGGDDTTGDGTEASPYATISKAYSEVADNGTIYLLSDLDVSAKITFNHQKTVTITSADENDKKTIYSKYNATGATDPVMNVTKGEIIFKDITIDGSGQKNADDHFLSPCFIYCEANGATATMDEGTTITGFKKDYGTQQGGASVLKATTGGARINIKDGVLITGCEIFSGNTDDPSSILSAGSGGTVYMTGGKITGNTLSSDQENTTAIVNIGQYNTPHFWMTGGEITGNTINSGCAAVYMRGAANDCDMEFGDTAYVFGNYVNGENGEQRNIYLKNKKPDGSENSNVYIKLCSALTGNAKLGVYAEKIGIATKVAQGGGIPKVNNGSYTAAGADTTYFVSDKATDAEILYCGGSADTCGLLAHNENDINHNSGTAAIYLSVSPVATGTKGNYEGGNGYIDIAIDRCTKGTKYVILDKNMKPVDLDDSELTNCVYVENGNNSFQLPTDSEDTTIKLSKLAKTGGPYTVMLVGDSGLTVDSETGKATTTNLTDIATINVVNFTGDGVKWTDSTDSTKTFKDGDFDVITVPHNDQTGKAAKTYIATTETGYIFKEMSEGAAAIAATYNNTDKTALSGEQFTATKAPNEEKYTVKVTVPDYAKTSQGANTTNYTAVTLTGTTEVSCGVKLLDKANGREMQNSKKTYDGAPVAYQEGGVTGATLTYTWQKKDSADSENYTDITNKTAPSDAGDYNLKVEAKKTSNQTLLKTENIPFSIEKKGVTAKVTVADKVYDGNTTATITKIELKDAVTGDDVKADTTKLVATFQDANAGENKSVQVNPTEGNGDKVLTGAKAGNYILAQDIETNKPTITKAEGKASVTLTGWTYGETPKTPGVSSTTNGTKGVTYRYKVKGASTYLTGVPTDAGEYEIEAIFPASDNYDTVTATATFTIQPKALTVTVTAQDKTYDGSDAATLNTPTLNGVLDADKTAVTLNTTNVKAVFADKNVGDNKAITVTGYTLNGNEKGNYTLTQPTGLTASIKSAPSSSSSSSSGSSSSSSNDTAVTSAHTADESPIVLWLALLLISAGACAAVLGKKKFHK